MEYFKLLRSALGSQPVMLNAAVVVIRDSEGRILLQHRSDNGRWGLIGGLMDLNETYGETALREAREETGLEIRLEDFLGIFHNHRMVWANGDQAHVITAFYTAGIAGGALRTDAESLELRWFDANDLPELFAEDHRAAIAAYLRGVRLPIPEENRWTNG